MDYLLNPAQIPWGQSEHILMLNQRLPIAAQEILQENLKVFLCQKKINEPYLFLSSSGSTVSDFRFLKLLGISQKSFQAHGQMIQKFLNLTPRDIWLQVLPRFHVGGLAVEARQWISGMGVVSGSPWNLSEFQNILKTHGITYVSLVPTQIYDLVQHQIQAPASMKGLISGGGFLSEALRQAVEKLGWKVFLSYGMTETASMVSLSEDEYLRPFPEVQFSVSSAGFLGIKTPTLADFQIQRSSDLKSVESFSLADDHGFFWTQDRVLRDLRLLGRGTEFIKIGGEGTDLNFLRDIWSQIQMSHGPENKPSGHDFFLTARSHPRLGSEIILVGAKSAQGSRTSDFLKWALSEFANKVLPNQKIRALVWVDEIPKTDLGKVMIDLLNQKISKGDSDEIL